MNEPQWAVNLCQQALLIDPNNIHAFYQIACAYAAMGQYEDAVRYLEKVLSKTDSYRQEILEDTALAPLYKVDAFRELMALDMKKK